MKVPLLILLVPLIFSFEFPDSIETDTYSDPNTNSSNIDYDTILHTLAIPQSSNNITGSELSIGVFETNEEEDQIEQIKLKILSEVMLIDTKNRIVESSFLKDFLIKFLETEYPSINSIDAVADKLINIVGEKDDLTISDLNDYIRKENLDQVFAEFKANENHESIKTDESIHESTNSNSEPKSEL